MANSDSIENNQENEILLRTAKEKLNEAYRLLERLVSIDSYADFNGVKCGLEAIQTYVKHTDDIISWLKNALNSSR